LIGRLLADTGNVFIDQVAALERDSARMGNAGVGEIDYSLLVDGLKAEREQGITIDVAYRYFATKRRKYIIADCPGHEQYTRNMATGASTAELAVILIDARHGVLAQTKRHSFIATQLGIRHCVIAINKMDAVDFDQAVYDRIKADYQAFAEKLPRTEFTFIPVSALRGDNVVTESEQMPWYQGPTLLEHLETVQITGDRNYDNFVFPVQYVLRPNLDFRGYCGTVSSGTIRPGDVVRALPSGKSSTVKSIVTFEGEQGVAYPPQAVTLTLNDEIDISRGDVLVDERTEPHVGVSFKANLVWMHEDGMQTGKRYLFKHLCTTVPGAINEVSYRIDVNTLEHNDASGLALNEIGEVVVTLNRPIVFENYRQNRQAGAFIVIDTMKNTTVAAGMITDHVPYESDLTRNLLGGRNTGDPVTAKDRAQRHNQRPAVIWLSAREDYDHLGVARKLEQQLFDTGYLPYVLDFAQLSIDMRQALGVGEDAAIRDEHIRRAVSMSRLCADAGLVTVAVVNGDDEKDRELNVYIDVYEAGADQAAPGERTPDLSLPDSDSDITAVATRIIDLLRSRSIIGYFPGDDEVAI
nr:sulfate adenylyltransferase subunit CysN [Planctomycetota bacterium]